MSSTPSLSQRINTSTRPLHTRLNALILSFLPLALPPHTSDPQLYTTGLAHILPIYRTFEEHLDLLLARLDEDDDNKDEYWKKANGSEKEIPSRESRRGNLERALRRLHIPALSRTSRLHTDIQRLQRLHSNPHSTTSIVSNSANSPRLAAFTNHIHTTLPVNPHLVFAYTWIFYMALFSGGRYIRYQLRQAGPAFWNHDPHEKSQDLGWEDIDIDRVLLFWTFEGDANGEDIKAEFKRRFEDGERHLTEGNREEVVREAAYIMEAMIEVVEEITVSVGTAGSTESVNFTAGSDSTKNEKHDMGDDAAVQLRNTDEPSMQWLLLKHILPMGMVELMAGVVWLFMLGMSPFCKARRYGEL